MPVIDVSDEQAKLLVDVIDMHVQGIVASKDLTEVDPTVDSAEQLLDLMSGYDDDALLLQDVREQLLKRRGNEFLGRVKRILKGRE